MKDVILSAGGYRYVYCIPDEAADSLERYCMEFCDDWLKQAQILINTELTGFYTIINLTLLNI